jgi:hypothetical protein
MLSNTVDRSFRRTRPDFFPGPERYSPRPEAGHQLIKEGNAYGY